ncbi:helix-turn-helix transcriptional regulator [Acidithiobacillus ferriphilus]|uniref:helix-turn-helix domain-containing protein n=1 Tax=Acidithiobacillus ferriphilus TaxID=1689834 RepID=UPI001C07077D|nr:helix-turn-helix transcriptional regulator [Acidithiobacillus ferriphilus]MBU2847949.1 helix-turn-helix transcriptional regulator [Acidithiobacillus ferriphilus]
MSRLATLNALEWRVRVMMAERHIKTITELRKQLEEVGVEISTTQLGRIVDALPTRLSSEVLAGLTTVLRCDIGDLIRVARRRPPPTEQDTDDRHPSGTVPNARPTNDATPDSSPKRGVCRTREPISTNVTGPKVTALPIPERPKR